MTGRSLTRRSSPSSFVLTLLRPHSSKTELEFTPPSPAVSNPLSPSEPASEQGAASTLVCSQMWKAPHTYWFPLSQCRTASLTCMHDPTDSFLTLPPCGMMVHSVPIFSFQKQSQWQGHWSGPVYRSGLDPTHFYLDYLSEMRAAPVGSCHEAPWTRKRKDGSPQRHRSPRIIYFVSS